PMMSPPGYRTTAPSVATHQSAAPPASSRLGLVAMVLAALALLIVVAGAAVGVLVLGGKVAPGSNGPTAAPAPAPALPGGKPISLPNVGTSEDFERADATAVPLKNQAAIEACARKSHRFKGEIDIVVDVSTRDGRVVGTDCITVYP